MKDITEAALEHILAAHPNAIVTERDGEKIVRIPMYDIHTDRLWFEERRVKPDPKAKFQPGDVLRHTQTGQPFNIVDPLKAFLRLRRGPKMDD